MFQKLLDNKIVMTALVTLRFHTDMSTAIRTALLGTITLYIIPTLLNADGWPQGMHIRADSFLVVLCQKHTTSFPYTHSESH